MLGENREIFFPKLKEVQMMTFDAIGTELLREYGYETLPCHSDEEAIEKAEELKNGKKQYPVHYSVSNTSGEKAYEEFYTDEEEVDLERFASLGVVTGKEIPDYGRIEELFRNLYTAFEKDEPVKEEIVEIIQAYLPNFEHMETGKSLDNKM